jgi:Asp/Glu/hydantoin racemase
MRIAFLAQKIIASIEELESFTVFQQLAEATSHIPILEDWALLERSEQKRLTAEREKIEKDYSEFVAVGANSLAKLRLN